MRERKTHFWPPASQPLAPDSPSGSSSDDDDEHGTGEEDDDSEVNNNEDQDKTEREERDEDEDESEDEDEDEDGNGEQIAGMLLFFLFFVQSPLFFLAALFQVVHVKQLLQELVKSRYLLIACCMLC